MYCYCIAVPVCIGWFEGGTAERGNGCEGRRFALQIRFRVWNETEDSHSHHWYNHCRLAPFSDSVHSTSRGRPRSSSLDPPPLSLPRRLVSQPRLVPAGSSPTSSQCGYPSQHSSSPSSSSTHLHPSQHSTVPLGNVS